MLRPVSPSFVLIFLLLPGWRLCEGEHYSGFGWKFPTTQNPTKGNTDPWREFHFDLDPTPSNNNDLPSQGGNLTTTKNNNNNNLQSGLPTNDESTTAKNDYKTSEGDLQWKFRAKRDFDAIMENMAQVDMSLFEQNIDKMRVLLNNVTNTTAVADTMLAPYWPFGAKMYKTLVDVVPQTYDEAKAACEAEGAVLPTPKDQTELSRLTRNLFPWLLQDSAWLGLRRNATAGEHHWVWGDGEPLGGWQRWGVGVDCYRDFLQPQVEWLPSISLRQRNEFPRPAVQPPMCPTERLNCAHMGAGGTWTKATCDNKAKGICERPVPGCESVRPREVFRVVTNSRMSVYSKWEEVASSNWAQWNVKEVIVELFKNHSSVVKLVFDGKGTDHLNWFSSETLLVAPWTDLNHPTFFSIKGGEKDARRFFIHQDYLGCSFDRGWLAVLESQNPPCAWERPHGYTDHNLPIILYSKSPGKVNWARDPQDVGVADTMTVSIVECLKM
ncbi:PREDICTED: uncharacterized protein LOC109476695 [Branchiostoma belcheri]|uniref:Uncharacterized protein LOC109476695 n=1 Tax=Branchiostoma belcheri TaxID=7741 RepID=A0A6P4YV67_BRABE|nr:PREDICTED: uncharacterized protein LOC109476695 [Branchiostoma belcheri]